MKPPTHLETPRLLLRPPEMGDAEAIFERYATDPEVTKYLVWRPHGSIEETRAFLKRCGESWVNGSAYPWVIVLRENGGLIGMAEIRLHGDQAELGYVLARPWWGKGYMTEAVRAIVGWTVAQPSIRRVWAICDVDNPASGRVLENVGLRFEGIQPRSVVHPNISGEPRDSRRYVLEK